MTASEKRRMVVHGVFGRKKCANISKIQDCNERELEFQKEAKKALQMLYRILNEGACSA